MRVLYLVKLGKKCLVVRSKRLEELQRCCRAAYEWRRNIQQSVSCDLSFVTCARILSQFYNDTQIARYGARQRSDVF